MSKRTYEITFLEAQVRVMSVTPLLRRARPKDAYHIIDLYQRVYDGTYSDPMMRSPQELMSVLAHEDYHWILAESEGEIVGSVVYRYDPTNALAKVYGAVVDSKFRGKNLTEKLMEFGYSTLRKANPPVEVIYATTRTVSHAPQKLTSNMGYKKLGIFPNVHKTDGYETHCLTAFFTEEAKKKRFSDFELHPKVLPLYEIAAQECGLARLDVASEEKMEKARSQQRYSNTPFSLEVIQAVDFVKYRFSGQKITVHEHHWFYPFHEPNLLLTSPDQQVEIFCFYSQTDKHCVLIGLRDMKNLGYARILDSAAKLLHELGVRYLEFIMRADEIENIEMSIQAEFIPCAYFPSMHRQGNQRYDFIAFSRSFEILNFRNIKLEGVNRLYLQQYFNLWKELSFSSIQAS